MTFAAVAQGSVGTRGWDRPVLSPRTAALTMARMRDIVRDQVTDPRVFQTAALIVEGVRGQDFPAQAAAIAAWLRAHTTFLRDIEGVEHLRTPVAMIAEIAADGSAPGDCDDVAMLGAALAIAIGFPAKFVAESYSGPDAPFQHVYAAVFAGLVNGWLSLDVQRGDVPPVPALRQLEQLV